MQKTYVLDTNVLIQSPEALEAYQRDPYHTGVVKPFVAERRSASAAVDYILDKGE